MPVRSAWGHDASRFSTRIKQIPEETSCDNTTENCVWPHCRNEQHSGYPLCFIHMWEASRRFDDILYETEPAVSESPTSLVYYLMIAPTTVKIGFTANLFARLQGLRSELQYVVALESGGRELERSRHKQFSAERIGRREDFRLSESLREHITGLQDQRERLIETAEAERSISRKFRR